MTKALDIRVVIADDHPIFRSGLRQVLELDGAISVVAEVGDGEAALARVEALRPDVAVLDVNMPVRDGLEVARALRDARSATRVVFLTMYRDRQYLDSALDAGASGYVLKDGAVSEIADAVRTVAAGGRYVSARLTSLLLDRRDRADGLAAAEPGVADLTPTERRVLGLVAEYKTSREIAEVLCVSPRTVEHHRASAAAKLGLKGANALLKFAVEHRSEL